MVIGHTRPDSALYSVLYDIELESLQYTNANASATIIKYMYTTVDLVIFARFQFSRGGQIREFENPAKINNIIALLSSKLIIREF